MFFWGAAARVGALLEIVVREVVQRVGGAAVFFPAVEMCNRGGDISFGFGDRGMQRESFAKAGGDGGGVGAAGAVGGDAGDERRAEFRHFAVGEKQVGRRGAAQVAAFQKERGAVARGEFRAGGAHFVDGGDGAAEERGGFVEVRCDEAAALLPLSMRNGG